MNQLTLFDDGPQLARQADPVTSQVAAAEAKPSIHKAKEVFLLALADLGGVRTAREIGERAKQMGLHSEVETVRKRAAELERLKFIQVAEIRRCSVTGKLAEGWRLTSD